LVPTVVKAEAEEARRAAAMVSFILFFGGGKGFLSNRDYENVMMVGESVETENTGKHQSTRTQSVTRRE
jgi:hypothetical protein